MPETIATRPVRVETTARELYVERRNADKERTKRLAAARAYKAATREVGGNA